MDEMEEFKLTFFEECDELLIDMEERLMAMEEGSEDSEALNAIFRCAHSIKGGAGAFGFDAIVAFTHKLEALLDKMRSGDFPVTREAIDILLKSGDVVTKMLEAEKAGESLPDDFTADLSGQLKAFLDGGEAPAAADVQGEAVIGEAYQATEVQHVEAGFRIKFSPVSELFASGNDPFNVFSALSKLGTLSAVADVTEVPMHTDIDPTICYINWDLTISGDITKEEIHETFEFVEDLAEITIEPMEASAPVAPAPVETVAAEPEAVPEVEKVAAKPKAAAKPAAKPKPASGGSIRVDLDKIDRLVNMVGELVITEAMLRMQTRELDPEQTVSIQDGLTELSHHTRELQEAVMAVRMQPVSSIFSRMPRLVRETAGKLDKTIQLVLQGEQTEVDKTVVEVLGDPLTHMIRNSVDHGIEMPDVREAAGKPREGTINLSAFHRSGRIIIEISDDGAGINREKVLSKAREKGLIADDVHPTDEEIDHMIFMAGFSTADTVSDVSGRGVGMDVVRRNIESIGGTVHVLNRPGNGSTLTISLPLTLAILDGMIVRIGAEHYIMPTTSILESLRPLEASVSKVEGRGDVLNVREEFIPLVYLNRVFGVENSASSASEGLVVLVEANRQKMGLVVDELVGQQQVVIKSIEENADPVAGISGATILGDGKVSLILDIDKLWRLSQRLDKNDLPVFQKTLSDA